MAAPPQKMLKRDIFTTFHDDKVSLGKLKAAVTFLDKDVYAFRLLQVVNCDADDRVSFSDAYCKTRSNVHFADSGLCTYIYLFECIFQQGFKTVNSYIKDGSLPPSKGELMALERLLEFFTDVSQCERALSEPIETEAEWTVRLSHHLLSKLALNSNYIIDKNSQTKVDACPCCNQKIVGTYGDTSIGSTSAWHGYVDILLGVDQVAVQIAVKGVDSPIGNESSDEIKKHDEYKKSQIISETMVFSFLTKQRHPDYSSFLVPTIVITSDKASIYFYNCVNDILLESSPLPLLTAESNKPVLSTIFALWLTINFKYCCLGTPEIVNKADFKANFLKFIEPVSQIYEEGVKLGCGAGKNKSVYFNPMDFPFCVAIGSADEDKTDN